MNSDFQRRRDRNVHPINKPCTVGNAPVRKKPDGKIAARSKSFQTLIRLNQRRPDDYWSQRKRRVVTPCHVTLDLHILSNMQFFDKPSHVYAINISERKLHAIKQDDFKEFENVSYIDASINHLSFDALRCFVNVKQINLSLNRLRNLKFETNDYPFLEAVDLSYNNLPTEAVQDLGRLMNLKILHLSGNGLTHLIPFWKAPNPEITKKPTGEKEKKKGFEGLEVLMLDDNKLTNDVFYSLMGLNRLRHLELQGNRITQIPYMEEEDFTKAGQVQMEVEDREKHEKNVSTSKEKFKVRYVFLPELRYLNLANNFITTEEAVMAAGLFPYLVELDVHTNPLANRKRGYFPLITLYLQKALGIKVKMRKEQLVLKLPVKVFVDPQTEAEKISPPPDLPTIPFLMKIPRFKPSQADRDRALGKKPTTRKAKKKSKEKEEKKGETNQLPETKPKDKAAKPFLLPEEEQASRRQSKTKPKSEKCTCIDFQVDAKQPLEMVKPLDLQSAVWKLDYALRNHNVYRDPTKKLDSVQKPFEPMKKKIKELPPLKPVLNRYQRLMEILKEVKRQKQIPHIRLDIAVRPDNPDKEEQKLAQVLLNELKEKYALAHERTVRDLLTLAHGGKLDPVIPDGLLYS